MKQHVLVVAALAALATPAAASDQSSDEARRQALRNLNWLHGTQALTTSHGSFKVPSGDRLVAGADAKKFDQIVNGDADSDSEAIVESENGALYLTYEDAGWVSLDTWKDVDADKMLADMKQATDDGNDARVKAGVSAFHVVS
jgi:uncharacterized membrane-anchored protein